MNEDLHSESENKNDLQQWIKKKLKEGVYELMDMGVIDNELVEAKPAWVFPYTILIGKIRNKGKNEDLGWFICGDNPTSYIDASAATTPRGAAKHFALQWQLDANRKSAEPGPQADKSELISKATALYELTESSGLWLNQTEKKLW